MMGDVHLEDLRQLQDNEDTFMTNVTASALRRLAHQFSLFHRQSFAGTAIQNCMSRRKLHALATIKRQSGLAERNLRLSN